VALVFELYESVVLGSIERPDLLRLFANMAGCTLMATFLDAGVVAGDREDSLDSPSRLLGAPRIRWQSLDYAARCF